MLVLYDLKSKYSSLRLINTFNFFNSFKKVAAKIILATPFNFESFDESHSFLRELLMIIKPETVQISDFM